MKRNHFLPFILIVLISCTKENNVELSNDINQFSDNSIQSRILLNHEIPEDDIYYLQQLGFSGSKLQVYENQNSITGEIYVSYILEGDIEIRADELEDYLPPELLHKGTNLTRQYRARLIVPANTYYIYYNSGNPTISQGIDLAIFNYNSLNLGIRFVRTNISYSTRTLRGERTIFISHANLGKAGGRAGFPRIIWRRNPALSRQAGSLFYTSAHRSILIDTRTVDFGLDVVEHVITHEIGHCIGLRHTDFFNRSLSGCSDGGNEGQGSYGAIHIPGTPAMSNTDRNSVMKACFNGEETGEFTNFDITALQTLW